MKTLFDLHPGLKYSKPSDLVDEPVVIRVNEFTEATAAKFAESMDKAHGTGQPIVPIVIDSYGGYCDSLFAMLAEIESSRLPIATICVGKAMSCGQLLLAFGSRGHRYADPNSRLMMHDVYAGGAGKVEDVKADAREFARLQKHVFRTLAKKCGQPRDYFLEQLAARKNVDWYLTPREALRHGLVDHLRVPVFRVRVEVSIEIE